MFKKYHSIENSYQQKNIDNWLRRYPQLAMEQYILMEKIHGANISFYFEKDKFEVARRTAIIEPNEKFYNIWGVIPEYRKYISIFKRIIDSGSYDNIRVYGELFGGGVQKGVDYGPKQRILFYDVEINGILMSPKWFIEWMTLSKMGEVIVPIIKIVDSLEEAVNFNIETMNSMVLGIDDNIIEGTVIKPFNTTFTLPMGGTFMLKNKTKAFEEKKSIKKTPKITEIDPEVQKLKDIFNSYITSNRLQGIFSKYGEITSSNQLGEYIKYMINDAREDFLKDNLDELKKLDKKATRTVFNASKEIVKMLSDCLMNK